jgi:N-acyl-phosphatidylethanolamine-hydrolysing phospholipase D
MLTGRASGAGSPAYPASDHYDGRRFHAAWPTGPGSRWQDAFKFFFGGGRPAWHDVPVNPTVPPRSAGPGGFVVTWIGHASLLVQLEGVNLLTDPQWSYRASPVRWAGPRRYMAPGVRFGDLPPIHLVLLSHNHYDHMDRDTLVRLYEAFHPVFCVPLGDAALLAAWGIPGAREMDWWDHETVSGAGVTCVPAQHFSSRSPFDRDRTLWAGWVVKAGGRSFYFAGDTGYGPFFRDIGARLGPFDLAAIPIGAYDPPGFMLPIHLNPEQAVVAHQDVGAARSLAIHWGTFKLTLEPQDEPPARLRTAAAACLPDPDRFWIFRAGETRVVPRP